MTATPDATSWDHFVYSQQPGYDETATRAAFAGAVPLKTIVIYCYDPRAAAIPFELAKLWPDETYPGDLILDDQGTKVGRRPPSSPRMAPTASQSVTSRLHSAMTSNCSERHPRFRQP